MNLQQRLHAMVWEFRRQTADAFPIPCRLDSLRFACTEVCEGLDAWLRENGEYKRNREKGHDLNRELAQAAMMLLTAYGPGEYPDGRFYYANKSLDCIVVQTASCLSRPDDDGRIRFAVWQICAYVGPEIEEELAQVLADLKAKHTPVAAAADEKRGQLHGETLVRE